MKELTPGCSALHRSDYDGDVTAVTCNRRMYTNSLERIVSLLQHKFCSRHYLDELWEVSIACKVKCTCDPNGFQTTNIVPERQLTRIDGHDPDVYDDDVKKIEKDKPKETVRVR